MFQKPVRPRAPSETFLHDEQAAKIVRDKLRFVLEYGVLAPGGHPWVIAMGEGAVELRLGHLCERPSADRLHRDAILGCGIGLAQLRLALRQLGCADSTILLPEERMRDLLARVYIDRVEEEMDPQSFVLYQALYAEVSKVPRLIDRPLQEELGAHAAHERALIEFVSLEDFPPSESPVPCGAPTLGAIARRLPWMDSRLAAGDPSEDVAFVDSVSAIIATRGDGVADWLTAGQALARVALRARVEGLCTRVTSAPGGMRVAGGAFAQVLLRIGVPQRVSRVSQAPAGPPRLTSSKRSA
jgi:hypothetical protein